MIYIAPPNYHMVLESDSVWLANGPRVVGMVTLRVEDDWVGFKMPEKWVDLLHRQRYGLAGMAERIQSFGGELGVTSKPAKGTTVQVSVPIQRPATAA